MKRLFPLIVALSTLSIDSAFALELNADQDIKQSDQSIDNKRIQILNRKSENEEKTLILGERNEKLLVREDLVPIINELALNDKDIKEQLIVHSRAHDAFMMAHTPDESYNAYLMMKSAQFCLSEMGLGRYGAQKKLMALADKQLNTEFRITAVGRAESLFVSMDYPMLEVFTDKRDYCQFTSTNPIYNKELAKELERSRKNQFNASVDHESSSSD